MTQPNKTPTGIGQLGSAETEVPDWFARYFEAAMSNPLLYVPKVFETWMTDRVAVAGLDVPIGQIVGFNLFVPQIAPDIATEESTTSTTYVSLTTTGPELSGLPNGSYLLLYSAEARSSNTDGASAISPQVNSTAPSDGDSAAATGSSEIGMVGFTTKTLTAGNNTITLKYRAAGSNPGTSSFKFRRLIALRYTNA